LNSTANNRFIFLGFIAAGFTNIFGMLAASEFSPTRPSTNYHPKSFLISVLSW